MQESYEVHSTDMMWCHRSGHNLMARNVAWLRAENLAQPAQKKQIMYANANYSYWCLVGLHVVQCRFQK